MRRDIGPHGLTTVKRYEGYAPYVYDDKAPPVHGKPPEWQGGPVRGTLTIGYGHTDAGRHPLKIAHGLRISEAEAAAVLHVDMGECVEQVNALVRVPVTQGQFDALALFTFNCGARNLKQLIVPLNRGDYDTTRANFMHYVRSKGEVMRGLERRRRAEQILWDDAYEELHAEHLPAEDEHVHHPAEVDALAPVRPAPPAHVLPVAISTAAAGGGEVLAQVNSTVSAAKETKESVAGLLGDVVLTPSVLLAVAIFVGVVILWLTHHRQD